MKSLRTMTAAIALLASLLTCASAQELVRVGTFVPETSTGVSRVIKPWMEAVNAAVGDSVRLQGFWGGTLGKNPRKQFELVQNGVVDVTWVVPAYTAGQFPQMGLFQLPFLFRTAEEASVVGWKLYEAGLLTGFDRVHVIGLWTASPALLFMEDPIDGPAGIAEKNIRGAGATQARWLEELGAVPQTLSPAEYNEGLKRGTIDGVIQGWVGMQTFKSFPLVSQAIEVPSGVSTHLLLMNKDKWSSLPENIQHAIMSHAGMAMAKAGADAYSARTRTILEARIAEGQPVIVVPEAAETEAYEERAKGVHDWWIARTENGRAVYEEARRILAEMRSSD